MSDEARVLGGILLLSLVTVETGGLHLVRVVTGRHGVTPFQEKFARAGHAHAAVLLVLALVVQLYADGVDVGGAWEALARTGVAGAAILMPAGFFLSSLGSGRTEPSRWVHLVYVGAVLVAANLVVLGVALLRG